MLERTPEEELMELLLELFMGPLLVEAEMAGAEEFDEETPQLSKT